MINAWKASTEFMVNFFTFNEFSYRFISASTYSNTVRNVLRLHAWILLLWICGFSDSRFRIQINFFYLFEWKQVATSSTCTWKRFCIGGNLFLSTIILCAFVERLISKLYSYLKFGKMVRLIGNMLTNLSFFFITKVCNIKIVIFSCIAIFRLQFYTQNKW